MIVGYGSAGRAAHAELLQHSRGGRSITIIDTTVNPPIEGSSQATFRSATATALDLSNKTVTLSDESKVKFKTLLISTGAYSLSAQAVPDSHMDPGGEVVNLSSAAAVSELISLVSNGKHVTVLGGDQWSSVSIALMLGAAARRAGYSRAVTLVSSQPGILSPFLPRFLSVAYSRRLSSRRPGGADIECVTNSVVRFIGGSDVARSVDKDESKPDGLVVFVANALDSLDTNFFVTDRVAALPRLALPPCVGDSQTVSSNSSFVLAGGADDNKLEPGELGGLVVNSSLAAAAGVFVAGDAANLRLNPVGRGVWTGWDHAIASGQFAARAMMSEVENLQQQHRSGLYRHMPVFDCIGGEEHGLHLALVGHCSQGLDSHSFWWRVSAPSQEAKTIAAKPSSVGKKQPTPAAPEPAAASSVMDSLQDWLGMSSGGPVGIDAAPTKVKCMGRKGLVKMPPRSVDGGLSESVRMPPPLGLGVVIYIEVDRVVGVAISGLPRSKASAEVLAVARAALGLNIAADPATESSSTTAATATATAHQQKQPLPTASGGASFDIGGGDRWDPRWELQRLRRQEALLQLAKSLISPAVGSSSDQLPRPQVRFTPHARGVFKTKGPCLLQDERVVTGGVEVARSVHIKEAYLKAPTKISIRK